MPNTPRLLHVISFQAVLRDHYPHQHILRKVRASRPACVHACRPCSTLPLVTVDRLKQKVINIDEEYLYEGKEQAWGPRGVSRQWMTRLEYLSRSPYEVSGKEEGGETVIFLLGCQ